MKLILKLVIILIILSYSVLAETLQFSSNYFYLFLVGFLSFLVYYLVIFIDDYLKNKRENEDDSFLGISLKRKVTLIISFLSITPLVAFGLSVNYFFPEHLYDLIGIFLIIIVMTLIILVLVGNYFSKNFTDPIQDLTRATKEVEKGNFNIGLNIKTKDELEILSKALNNTTKALSEIDKERKQIDQAKTQFISITSHELRSPMTPMKAQLQMLVKGYFGKLSKKQKDSIEMVIRNTDRLDKIIVDFLEISRIEAARLKFHFIMADLKKTAKDLINDMKGFMPEKKIKIISNIDELPLIECDPDRISQVLRNLINNAIKFTPKNGKIIITVKKKKDHLLFSVRDSGIGISPEDQIRIFEPFYQAEQTIYRRKGGTGLGLAICKGIVDSQNGNMWIESKVGKGTTFYFTVPFKPVKEIKPIKVLFSAQTNIERKIKDLFDEILGPIGNMELNDLKNKNKLNRKELLRYFSSLEKEGIIGKEELNKCKKIVSSLYGTKKEMIDEKKLLSKRLIKK